MAVVFSHEVSVSLGLFVVCFAVLFPLFCPARQPLPQMRQRCSTPRGGYYVLSSLELPNGHVGALMNDLCDLGISARVYITEDNDKTAWKHASGKDWARSMSNGMPSDSLLIAISRPKRWGVWANVGAHRAMQWDLRLVLESVKTELTENGQRNEVKAVIAGLEAAIVRARAPQNYTEELINSVVHVLMASFLLAYWALRFFSPIMDKEVSALAFGPCADGSDKLPCTVCFYCMRMIFFTSTAHVMACGHTYHKLCFHCIGGKCTIKSCHDGRRTGKLLHPDANHAYEISTDDVTVLMENRTEEVGLALIAWHHHKQIVARNGGLPPHGGDTAAVAATKVDAEKRCMHCHKSADAAEDKLPCGDYLHEVCRDAFIRAGGTVECITESEGIPHKLHSVLQSRFQQFIQSPGRDPTTNAHQVFVNFGGDGGGGGDCGGGDGGGGDD